MRSLKSLAIGILFGFAAVPLGVNSRVLLSKAQREPQQIQPHAWIKEQGSEEVLFDFFQSETRGPDSILRETRFVERASGEDAFREKILTDASGLKLTRYDVEQLQIDEKGSIEVKRETQKIHFRYFKNNKWKESTEDLKEPFVVGGMIPDLLRTHREQIDTDRKLKFSLAVPYMTQSFDFYLVEEKKRPSLAGKDFESFKMAPSHFLVSAVVKPLHFLVPSGQKQVERIWGKVFLKKRVKNGWDAFQAETLFLENKSPSVAQQN